MRPDERTVADEGEEDELHHDRLMALLHDLVRKHGGRSGAARVLGIDRRTVAACMDGKGMSWRMREALERGLQEGAGSAAARQRKRSDALERRVDALEKDASRGPRCRQGRDREAARGRSPEVLSRLERRRARREAPRESAGSGEAPSAAGQGPEKTPAATRPAAAGVPKRLYPELGDEGARSRRRGGLRRCVAAHPRVARAMEDTLRRGPGPDVAGGRGARPGAGGGDAGGARADAATGDDAADGTVAERAAELAQGDPPGGPQGGGMETVGEASPHVGPRRR